MRVVVLSCLLAAASVAAVVASPAQQAESEKGSGGITVTLRGCVSGSLLKGVSPDADSGPGITPSDRYRMIGSKQIKGQIKKANKALVAVTGRVQPGPQAVTRGGKVGGTAIGIGVAPGSASMDQQAPYTPTIEVDAIDVIASTCGK